MRTITLASLLRAAICAIGIAVAIKLLRWAWRRWWHIEVSQREGGILGALLIGLLVGFDFTRSYVTAATVAGIVLGTYFTLKIVGRAVN
jgi:hypothetical protein